MRLELEFLLHVKALSQGLVRQFVTWDIIALQRYCTQLTSSYKTKALLTLNGIATCSYCLKTLNSFRSLQIFYRTICTRIEGSRSVMVTAQHVQLKTWFCCRFGETLLSLQITSVPSPPMVNCHTLTKSSQRYKTCYCRF